MIILYIVLFGLMCLAGLLITLFSKELMIALAGVLITLLGVSGLMVIALADFNAVVQIMVYVGGIVILLIFGYMISNRQSTTGHITLEHFNRLSAFVMAGSLLALLTVAIMKSKFEQLPHFFAATVQEKADSTITGIGIAIFTQYLIAFEIAGLLLLTAFIYSASLTRMEKQD